MKVLLLEKIKNLGDVGNLVTIKNGYARNYLLPKGKVLEATNKNKARFKLEKSLASERSDRKRQDALKEFNEIDGKTIKFIKNASNDGKLYGSINSEEIIESLESKFRVKISSGDIILNNKIKHVGSYSFIVNLHLDINAKLTIIVSKSNGENNAQKESGK